MANISLEVVQRLHARLGAVAETLNRLVLEVGVLVQGAEGGERSSDPALTAAERGTLVEHGITADVFDGCTTEEEARARLAARGSSR